MSHRTQTSLVLSGCFCNLSPFIVFWSKLCVGVRCFFSKSKIQLILNFICILSTALLLPSLTFPHHSPLPQPQTDDSVSGSRRHRKSFCLFWYFLISSGHQHCFTAVPMQPFLNRPPVLVVTYLRLYFRFMEMQDYGARLSSPSWNFLNEVKLDKLKCVS
jgi:hypothetical protein